MQEQSSARSLCTEPILVIPATAKLLHFCCEDDENRVCNIVQHMSHPLDGNKYLDVRLKPLSGIRNRTSFQLVPVQILSFPQKSKQVRRCPSYKVDVERGHLLSTDHDCTLVFEDGCI